MGTVRPRNNYGAILDAGKLKAFTYNMHDVHVVRGLELSQVRLLAELSRANGITSAASNIGLSQSAASHALAKLRKQLGDPLFLRTGNGLRPTPYGQRVGLAAREALEVLVTGLASNRPFEPRTATRTFSCYMSDVGMMVMLPSLMTYMKKHAPGSSVRSAPIPLINPGSSLSSGDVDVAVGFFDNLSSGFVQRFLFRERYVCIVRSGHAGFRGGMSVAAFKNVEHAMADATGMAHAVIDRSLEKHKIPRTIALRVPGFQMLPAIVANSDLVAIIPGRLADTYGRHLPIKVLPTPIPMHRAGDLGPDPHLPRAADGALPGRGQRQALLVETIHGMSTVKALALEPRRRRAWEERVARRRPTCRSRSGRSRRSRRPAPAAGEADAGRRSSRSARSTCSTGGITVGALVAFQMLSEPRLRAAGAARLADPRVPGDRALGPHAGRGHEPRAEPRRRERGLRPHVRGAITFDEVSLLLRRRRAACSTVGFSLPAGTFVGIVGRSGSGKTTITRLIQGLLPAAGGRVRIDGVNVRELDLPHLRRSSASSCRRPSCSAARCATTSPPRARGDA